RADLTTRLVDLRAHVIERPDDRAQGRDFPSRGSCGPDALNLLVRQAHFFPNLPHSFNHALQLLLRRPPRRLAQAAGRREGEPFRWRELQTEPDPIADVLRGLDVVALH